MQWIQSDLTDEVSFHHRLYTSPNPKHHPQASDCTDTYGGSSTLPTVVAAKCDTTTCDTITADLDVVKECFKGEMSCNLKLAENYEQKNMFYRSIGYSMHWDVLRLRRDDVAVGVGRQVLVDHLHHAYHRFDCGQGLLHRCVTAICCCYFLFTSDLKCFAICT